MITMEEPRKVQGKAVGPSFTVEFPSKGQLGYLEKATFRVLTVGELKALFATEGEDSLWELLKQVAKDSLISDGIDIESLVIQDFIAVIIGLRVNSLEHDLDLLVTCPCGSQFTVSVDLTKLKEVPAKDIEEPIYVNEELGIKACWPRVKDFNPLKAKSPFDVLPAALNLPPSEVDNLPAPVASAVVKAMSEKAFGYDLVHEKVCGSCGRYVKIPIELSEFFRL